MAATAQNGSALNAASAPSSVARKKSGNAAKNELATIIVVKRPAFAIRLLRSRRFAISQTVVPSDNESAPQTNRGERMIGVELGIAAINVDAAVTPDAPITTRRIRLSRRLAASGCSIGAIVSPISSTSICAEARASVAS